jgi:hypothetical protein
MPYILPLAVLDMGLAYAIDKYNVLRVYKRPAHTSSNLSQALPAALLWLRRTDCETNPRYPVIPMTDGPMLPQ